MCHKQRLEYACAVGLDILHFGDLLWEEHAFLSSHWLGPRTHSCEANLYKPTARSQTHIYLQACKCENKCLLL